MHSPEVTQFAKLKNKGYLATAFAVWVPAVAYGFWILLQYSTTPGSNGNSPAIWPNKSGLSRSSQRSTLLLFAHPQCPCSRASLGELERIVAQAGNRLDVNVFFYSSPQEPETWVKSGLWKQASEIPGVRVLADPEGKIARGFGARTSGHTLLYNQQGRLQFSGGITVARGHSGDNPGTDAVVVLLSGNSARFATLPAKTKIFGCGLGGE